jgi:hypothetical protein
MANGAENDLTKRNARKMICRKPETSRYAECLSVGGKDRFPQLNERMAAIFIALIG